MRILFSGKHFTNHNHTHSLASACRRELPRECCGILTGRQAQGEVIVEGFRVMKNAAVKPETGFAFDPVEWVETLYSFARGDQDVQLVGLFHSHPAAPAVPSQEDMESLWETPVHVIVSLENSNRPILRCYCTLKGRSWEEQPIRYRNG